MAEVKKRIRLRRRVLRSIYPALIKAGKLFGLKARVEFNIDHVAPEVSFYSLKMIANNGIEFDFERLKGKKVLIVNTASKCGNTPQYETLEKLYEAHKDKLVVIGFPANNFHEQEPGTNSEIQEFCKKNYGVSFPMSGKVSVKGDDIDPLFKYLVDEADKMGVKDPIKWNFTKFLVDENGKLLTVIDNRVKGQELTDAVTKYLN